MIDLNQDYYDLSTNQLMQAIYDSPIFIDWTVHYRLRYVNLKTNSIVHDIGHQVYDWIAMVDSIQGYQTSVKTIGMTRTQTLIDLIKLQA